MIRALHFSLLALVIGLFGCESTVTSDSATRLRSLIEREWQFRLEESPLFATAVGDHRWNDRLPSLTLVDLERRTQARREFVSEL